VIGILLLNNANEAVSTGNVNPLPRTVVKNIISVTGTVQIGDHFA
jgi:hypothetical protein